MNYIIIKAIDKVLYIFALRRSRKNRRTWHFVGLIDIDFFVGKENRPWRSLREGRATPRALNRTSRVTTRGAARGVDNWQHPVDRSRGPQHARERPCRIPATRQAPGRVRTNRRPESDAADET